MGNVVGMLDDKEDVVWTEKRVKGRRKKIREPCNVFEDGREGYVAM